MWSGKGGSRLLIVGVLGEWRRILERNRHVALFQVLWPTSLAQCM